MKTIIFTFAIKVSELNPYQLLVHYFAYPDKKQAKASLLSQKNINKLKNFL